MNKTLIALALFGVVGSASATLCPDGLDFSAHPEGRCDWYYAGTDPTKQTASGATAGSDAKAGAAAGALAGSLAANDTRVVVDASGAPVSAEARQAQRQQQQQAATAVGGGLSGTIGVSGGSNTYNTSTKINTIILPPLPMGPALAPFAPSNSTGITTACMPRKIVWREPVTVISRNSFWPDTVEQIGWDESLRDDPKAPNGYILKAVPVGYDSVGNVLTQWVPHGTQAHIKKELTNASSGSSFGIGAGGSGGMGQVGGMSQGGVQRWTTSIEVFDCPLTLKAWIKEVEKEVEVEVERKKIGG